MVAIMYSEKIIIYTKKTSVDMLGASYLQILFGARASVRLAAHVAPLLGKKGVGVRQRLGGGQSSRQQWRI